MFTRKASACLNLQFCILHWFFFPWNFYLAVVVWPKYFIISSHLFLLTLREMQMFDSYRHIIQTASLLFVYQWELGYSVWRIITHLHVFPHTWYFQSCEKWIYVVMSHPVYNILLYQLEWTNTNRKLYLVYALHILSGLPLRELFISPPTPASPSQILNLWVFLIFVFDSGIHHLFSHFLNIYMILFPESELLASVRLLSHQKKDNSNIFSFICLRDLILSSIFKI